jgi:DNA-directed RNA polymerase specialized sigma24 family protein
MSRHPSLEARDERDLRILEMHVVEDLTALEIGNRMGMTRNSVLGVMHRIRTADAVESDEIVDDAYARGGGTLNGDWHWSSHGCALR